MGTGAIVLFAHGARDRRWAAPFEAVAERVRGGAPGRVVRLAFLELMQPSLREAVDDLVAQGVADIDVVPLFLGSGGHLRDDLPRLADAARASHPALRLRLHLPIGEDESVIAAMAAAAVRASDE
jgi:sirohydrochlorin cobaltochelatase